MKKCPWCDTTLEFEANGHVIHFTAHDDQFCKDMTRYRVQVLQQVLEDVHEQYKRRIDRMIEDFDRILEKAGLPSLEERAKEADMMAALIALFGFLLDRVDFEDLDASKTKKP